MKTKKLMIFILSVLIFYFGTGFRAYADELKNMTDISGRLNDMEIDRLEGILDSVSEETGINISAVITDNLEGKNAYEYAENFFAVNYKDYPDSMILLVNYDTNNDIIYVTGNAEKYFNEKVKSDIISGTVSPAIAGGHISDAITGFADESLKVISSFAPESEPESEKTQKSKETSTAILIVSGLAAGVFVGIITGVYIKSRYQRTYSQFAVSNYKCGHKISFDVHEDKFRREFVKKSENDEQT